MPNEVKPQGSDPLSTLEAKFPAASLREGKTAGGGAYIVRDGKWTAR